MEISDSGQQQSETPINQRNIPKTLRWEDLDGTEDLYGKLSSEWAESETSKDNRILWGRSKKYQPEDKEENMAYTNFMLNIVDGLDENMKQEIYWRADCFKNIIPGDNDSKLKSIMNNNDLQDTKDSNIKEICGKENGMTKKRKTVTHIKSSTSSSDDKFRNSIIESARKNMLHIKSTTLSNESDSTITIIQPKSKVNKAELPDIFMLRGITPGDQPRWGDLPEGMHKPLEQVPPASYFGKLVGPTGGTDPRSSDTSESDISSVSSSVSLREKLRKAVKQNRIGRKKR